MSAKVANNHEAGRGSEACVEAESTVPKARTIFFQSREPGGALLIPGFQNLILQTFIAFRLGSARLWSKLPWAAGRADCGPAPLVYGRRVTMLRTFTTLALIAGSLTIAACNTVRGAAADVNSVANKVDNAT